METSESYRFVFKTTEGKKKRKQVNRKVYESWDEGDKAKKVKGEHFPQRVG
jgi:hypothetical protein